jgi:hypothetical protein
MTIRVSRSAIVGIFVSIAVIAVVWYLTTSSGPTDTRPVVLPPTFMGLNIGSSNHGDSPEAMAVIREQVNGAPSALTTYGEVKATVVNVVATRADLTGKVDLHFAGDNGRLVGNTRCTRNVVLREAGEDMDKPGSPLRNKMLCWRTSKQLSISVFVLIRPPAEEDLAAAVDSLWNTLR